MKHKVGFNALSRRAGHRKSLIRNMAISLLKYERIKTTITKAKELRKIVEKLITRAKVDSVHNRRIAAKKVHEKSVLAKLFGDIAPRFSNRMGGYTRILKLGQREGDASEMVYIELIERKPQELKRKPKKVKEESSKD